MTASLNIIFQRTLGLAWDQSEFRLRGQLCYEGEQAIARALLRHRQSSTTIPCTVSLTKIAEGLYDYLVSADLANATLLRGHWDLRFTAAQARGRDEEIPVTSTLSSAAQVQVICSQRTFWNLTPSPADGFWFMVERADAHVLSIVSFDWVGPNQLRIEADTSQLPGGYEVKALCGSPLSSGMSSPEDSCTVSTAVERTESGANVIATLDIEPLFAADRAQASIFWRVDRGDASMDVAVAVLPVAQTANAWVLPSQPRSPFEALVPSFNRLGHLMVTRQTSLEMGVRALSVSDWRRSGKLVLTLLPKKADDIYFQESTLPEQAMVDFVLCTDTGEEISVASNIAMSCGDARDVTLDIARALQGEHRSHYKLRARATTAGASMLLPVTCGSLPTRSRHMSFRANAVPHDSMLFRSVFIDSARLLNVEIRKRKKIERTRWRLADTLAKAAASVVSVLRPEHEIWLVGENLGRTAQDNGVVFFEYCRQRSVPEDVVYVARKHNVHAERLASHGKQVVRYDSLRHLYYYHRANRLVVAHGIRDVMPSLKHAQVGTNKKPVVYLQHGIIAMKRVFYNNQSYNGQIRAFVVSSDYEKSLLEQYNRMSPNRLVVTGLPRYDHLTSKPTERPTILLMPTWRDWAVRDETALTSSTFYREYRDFLSDPTLREMLRARGAQLLFYPHVEIEKRYLDLLDLQNEQIRVFKSAESPPLQDLLRSSWALITDYSSVAWDFNYMRKPVIFYQFDRQEYLAERGSYIDLAAELPGVVCQTRTQVIEALARLDKNGYQHDQASEQKSQRFYKYNDRRNSRRVYEAIRALKNS